MNTPECPWRPARWLTTDFVQPDNIAVLEQSEKLKVMATSDNDFVRIVATFVRDSFFYPLNKSGEPSAGLRFYRHDKSCCSWFYKKQLDYSWSFPNEVLTATKCGICIDTANLCTSLLRAGGIKATTALGAVMNAETDDVSGYHAWTEVKYRDEPCIIETTIHTPNAETIVKAESVYDKDSDWANSNSIYYKIEARYDESHYEGVGLLGSSMVQLLGLPAQRVQCYGMAHTLDRMEHKKKAIMREWRKSEALNHRILSRVYGGV
jgi:hypothetical protein